MNSFRYENLEVASVFFVLFLNFMIANSSYFQLYYVSFFHVLRLNFL